MKFYIEPYKLTGVWSRSEWRPIKFVKSSKGIIRRLGLQSKYFLEGLIIDNDCNWQMHNRNTDLTRCSMGHNVIQVTEYEIRSMTWGFLNFPFWVFLKKLLIARGHHTLSLSMRHWQVCSWLPTINVKQFNMYKWKQIMKPSSMRARVRISPSPLHFCPSARQFIHIAALDPGV